LDFSFLAAVIEATLLLSSFPALIRVSLLSGTDLISRSFLLSIAAGFVNVGILCFSGFGGDQFYVVVSVLFELMISS